LPWGETPRAKVRLREPNFAPQSEKGTRRRREISTEVLQFHEQRVGTEKPGKNILGWGQFARAARSDEKGTRSGQKRDLVP